MAYYNGSAAMPDAPPRDPSSIPMSIDIAELDEENEDEYEYEYSTIEKEVSIHSNYFLTETLLTLE